MIINSNRNVIIFKIKNTKYEDPSLPPTYEQFPVDSLYVDERYIFDDMYIEDLSPSAWNINNIRGNDPNPLYSIRIGVDIETDFFILQFTNYSIARQYYRILLSMIGKEAKSIGEMHPQLDI